MAPPYLFVNFPVRSWCEPGTNQYQESRPSWHGTGSPDRNRSHLRRSSFCLIHVSPAILLIHYHPLYSIRITRHQGEILFYMGSVTHLLYFRRYVMTMEKVIKYSARKRMKKEKSHLMILWVVATPLARHPRPPHRFYAFVRTNQYLSGTGARASHFRGGNHLCVSLCWLSDLCIPPADAWFYSILMLWKMHGAPACGRFLIFRGRPGAERRLCIYSISSCPLLFTKYSLEHKLVQNRQCMGWMQPL